MLGAVVVWAQPSGAALRAWVSVGFIACISACKASNRLCPGFGGTHHSKEL